MKINFANFKFSRAVIVIVATALIIVSGIGVPGLLISSSTSKSNLPQGVVDIAKINPYGSEVIERESNLLAISNAYHSSGFLLNDDLRSIKRANGYSDLGIQKSLAGEFDDGKVEFLSVFENSLEGYFPNTIPVSHYVVSGTVGGNDNMTISYVYDDNSYFVFDDSTGVPIELHYVIRSYNGCNAYDLATEIIRIYEEYIGISFTDFEIVADYSDGYKDSSYACVFHSADSKFNIVVNINSGWYFTAPRDNFDSWHETDLYEWTIDFLIAN